MNNKIIDASNKNYEHKLAEAEIEKGEFKWHLAGGKSLRFKNSIRIKVILDDTELEP